MELGFCGRVLGAPLLPGSCAMHPRTAVLQVAGEPLQAHYFGKPNLAPYLLVEQLLLAQAEALGLELPAAATSAAAADSGAGAGVHHSGQLARTPPPFSAIFAVGDNPAADVRGANAAGAPWVSVLVTQTGVARGNCAIDPAQASPGPAPAFALLLCKSGWLVARCICACPGGPLPTSTLPPVATHLVCARRLLMLLPGGGGRCGGGSGRSTTPHSALQVAQHAVAASQPTNSHCVQLPAQLFL